MSERAFYRPTWAEIRLSALGANLRKLKKTIGPRCRLMFVVKANAYGHGAAECARYAEERNLAWGFGVSSLEEGLALRRARIISPVLVLGPLYPFNSFIEAISSDLMVTISSVDAARQVAEAARFLGKKAVCHVKLETGMNRIGARRPAVRRIFEALSGHRLVSAAGLYTHLSSADTDPAYTRAQLAIFREAVEELRAAGFYDFVPHAANSAGACNYPGSRWGLVRSGLAAYGMAPGFSPVLSLKTRVVFIKNIRKGASVSYNRSFRAPRAMKVATIPAGYGDGYLRALSGKAEVLLRGRRCRVLGNVTMDMCMADVTALPSVRVGDEAVLIGRQGRQEITAGELAKKAGTIPYEITTLITARVPRVFK